MFPDLRYSAMLNSTEAFRSVVIDGALQQRGMASFKSCFGEEEAEAVRACITQRAHAALVPAPPAR